MALTDKQNPQIWEVQILAYPGTGNAMSNSWGRETNRIISQPGPGGYRKSRAAEFGTRLTFSSRGRFPSHGPSVPPHPVSCVALACVRSSLFPAGASLPRSAFPIRSIRVSGCETAWPRRFSKCAAIRRIVLRSNNSVLYSQSWNGPCRVLPYKYAYIEFRTRNRRREVRHFQRPAVRAVAAECSASQTAPARSGCDSGCAPAASPGPVCRMECPGARKLPAPLRAPATPARGKLGSPERSVCSGSRLMKNPIIRSVSCGAVGDVRPQHNVFLTGVAAQAAP